MCITGVPGGEERDPEKLSEEIIAENFPNTGKEIITKSRKHRVPGKINPRRNTPTHSNQK